MSQVENNQDMLMAAFLNTDIEQNQVIVKAEDVELSSGMDFKSIFFEPQVDKTYRIKFVQNPDNSPTSGGNLPLRRIYKNLPDPERRGKSFHHVSSGKADTDPVLELFFELNKLKKDGNALAEQKIKDYLSSTNQACSLVQVVTSDDDDIKAGEFRLWVFSNFGPNATIANLINDKVNPSKAEIEDGAVKQNIWDIFDSQLMLVQVQESNYDGQKGRDFTKSKWIDNKRQGVSVVLDDNSTYLFTPESKTATGLVPEALPAFKKLMEILSQPNLSIHDYFSYKEIGDPKNSEDTNNYLKKVKAKIDKIVPIIRNANNISEIEAACAADNSGSGDNKPATNQGVNILAESLPPELAGSVLDTAGTPTQAAPSTPISDANSEANSLLQGM